ncbi:MAG: hypothetical protein RBT33_02500 [Candidatus Dojkabacteria bacterium]|jgi:hypothetical protein|nr:hypothetical protein [Candidatus Dojkabacteria bacterium]
MEPKEDIQFNNEIIESEVLESFNNIDLLLEDEYSVHLTLEYDIDNYLQSFIEKEDADNLQNIFIESGLIPKDNHFRSFEININRIPYQSFPDHHKLSIELKRGILDFDREKYPNLSKENINTSNGSFEYSLERMCGLYNSRSMTCDSITFNSLFNSYEELIGEKLKGVKDVNLDLMDMSMNSHECRLRNLRKTYGKSLEEMDIKLLDWYFEILQRELQLGTVYS